MEPNYRIKVVIYDEDNDEAVVVDDQPMYSQEPDNVAGIYRALKNFPTLKEKHEATYYPELLK